MTASLSSSWSLSEHDVPPVLSRLEALAEEARRKAAPGEVAFYGGTFTALPRRVLSRLLESAKLRVEEGAFSGIRFSTRPDCLSPEVCALLRDYPVTTVELGVQSFDDVVLKESGRGYGADVAREAACRVRENGWQLGVQLMPGLPGDSREAFLRSVVAAVVLQPRFVRLYPTLVLTETALAEAYENGVYRPLLLEDAVSWCAEAYDLLERAGIAVARMGLHADPELMAPGRVVAGPFHPAFGYLVKVRWWRNRVDEALAGQKREEDEPVVGTFVEPGILVLMVPHRFLSEAIGPARANISHWQERWRIEHVTVRGEDTPPSGGFRIVWK